MDDELTLTIRSLAAHSEGMRAGDDRLKSFARSSIARRLAQLVASGALHKVELSPRNTRYYADVRNAMLAQQRLNGVSPAGARPPARSFTKPANWASIPADYSRAKVTECPAYAPRFTEVELPPGIHLSLQRGRTLRDEQP